MTESVPGRGEPYAGIERSTATAWVGWVLLGAIMLVLLGAVHLGTGLVALVRPEVLAGGRADLLVPLSLDALAGFHLVLGATAVVVGVGLVRGYRWARLSALLLAGAAAMVNFAFIAVHPVWSVTALVMIAVVSYAVSAHGAEVAGAYGDT
ncbi:hypothetical protein GCM10020358_82820 [Amorphoplanes nipponensis]|uniref:DUF7144 domain-containing protein n=1 Tax=Actinoplanes nipponensis TaxID=135950 RepID=A0A919JC93_9ACTN|nr:hypothetical protein [Actinoplanes nipponensis]GIE47168.1 hypothetical protein Ani05nite_07020 [Actinoplanes nipponensis]